MNPFASRDRLPLPDHWSLEQAQAVYELITALAEAISNRYELPAAETEARNHSQADLFDDDLES